ncbi:MAG: exodeoxyribonuclease III [Candidatus Saccharimonadia bacterium]
MASLKLLSWNVNGIRAVIRKGNFAELIEQENPDILCLQETKARPEQVELVLPGYHMYWNSADKPGYSGTAIFSKTIPLGVTHGFPRSLAKTYNFIDDETRDVASEGRVLTAEYPDFYLVTVYTPNAKDDLSRVGMRHLHWDPAFLAYVKELEESKPVVFCGDLNVAHTSDDLARPKENEGKKGFTKEEREGFTKFVEAGFIDSFRLFNKGNGHYSWWAAWGGARASNTGWRIDYFLISKSLKSKVKSAGILGEVMGSDHAPVSLYLDI